jgi:NhaP-type Na+/H+ or K+/H+ antiporter
MYLNAALLALVAAVYALLSGRVDRSRVSGPILFVLVGMLLGTGVLGALSFDATIDDLRLLAEITLSMVLFADAANADIDQIRRTRFLPRRLLFIGLPLTILLGLACALLLLPGLGLIEAALLAAALAPTDAALGKPVVVNPAVPPEIRESLNFESGLNDGICVPVIVLLLGAAVGEAHEGGALGHILLTVTEEIGIGLVVGAAIAIPGALLVGRARAAGWIGPNWTGVPAMGLAVACFALAQGIGGSGFIACFVGGLAFGARRPDRHDLLRGAESAGDVLSLLTWVVFGGLVVLQAANAVTLPVVLYAVLSLTVVRMLPVWLCLGGAGIGARDRLFIGWFGPRGLASIVFGVLILSGDLPGADTLAAVIVCTVLLSVFAHGASAGPLIRALAPGWASRAVRSPAPSAP